MDIAKAPVPFAPVLVDQVIPDDLTLFEVFHPKKGTRALIDSRMWAEYEKAGFRRKKA